MSLNIFWFLPTHGDGKYLGTAEGARAVDHGYLTQIAQAADRLGFGGVLIPTGRSCEDSWLVAASLIPVTQQLKFLVALRPGIISPTVAARQAATLDRLSGGRALFNLVTGGDPDELAGDGLNLSHEERYEASVEFTRIWRRVLEGETVDYAGKHIQVKGAKLLYPPIQQPRPPLYFGGSSAAAHDLAAEQQLQARSLRNGEGLVDNHQFYLATRPYAQKHPQVISTLIEEVRGVGEDSKVDPDAVTAQVAPLLGLSPEITRVAVKRQGYGAQPLTPAVVEAQQKIADTFTELRLIPKKLSIKDVIWTPPAGEPAKVAQQ